MTTLNIKRGDSKLLDLVVYDAAGDYMPLDGSYLSFTIKALTGNEDDEAIMSKTFENGGIVYINASEGEARIVIVPEDTEDFASDYRILPWDLQIVTGGGDVYTLDEGVANITKDITRER